MHTQSSNAHVSHSGCMKPATSLAHTYTGEKKQALENHFFSCCTKVSYTLSSSSPAVVCSPVTGDRDELQKELHTGQLVEDLGRLPVQTHRSKLNEELHHLHHLIMGVGARLRTFTQETKLIKPTTSIPRDLIFSLQSRTLALHKLTRFPKFFYSLKSYTDISVSTHTHSVGESYF